MSETIYIEVNSRYIAVEPSSQLLRTVAGAAYPDLAIPRNISYIRVMTKEVAMTVADSRTFRSGNSEAVRLPRNVAFGREVEVTIVRSGDVLTIYPARKPIGELVKQLEELPRPSEIETRDDEVLPEPSGL